MVLQKKANLFFRIMIFTHLLNTPGTVSEGCLIKTAYTYIRIRDESHSITLTYKTKDPESNFDNEDEVLIDNLD